MDQCIDSYWCIRMFHLPIYFRVASLVLEQLYHCPSADDATQKHWKHRVMSKNDKINEEWTMCIIAGIYHILWVCMCLYLYICMFMCMYVCVHICVCMCVCVRIYVCVVSMSLCDMFAYMQADNVLMYFTIVTFHVILHRKILLYWPWF